MSKLFTTLLIILIAQRLSKFFLLILLFSTDWLAPLRAEPAVLEVIAKDPFWLKLLHYQSESNQNHQYKSRVDSATFFLAQNGKFDPVLELQENIKAMSAITSSTGFNLMHAQCTFPLRFKFIKKQFNEIKFPKIDCPDYRAWKESLGVESVELVFSSAYANNPASLFGHTFFKFKNKNNRGDLLDYAANFGANNDPNDLSIVYAYRGLTGGYPGTFAIDPFYMKVSEYEYSENRDLWIYQLNLSRDEIQDLIDHLWELYSAAYFDYFFIDENCSFILMTLIDVIKPEWKVAQDYKWYVMPSDTVKKLLANPHVIKSISHRPSLKKRFVEAYEKLTPDQKTIFKNAESIAHSQSTEVIDAKILELELKKFKKKNKTLNAKEDALYQKFLLMRSKLSVSDSVSPSKSSAFQSSNFPHNSRPASQVLLSFTDFQSESFYRLGVFQLSRDIYSRDVGLGTFEAFNAFHVTLGYFANTKKILIDEILALELVSLHDYSFYDPQWSWTFKLAYDQLLFAHNCSYCRGPEVEISGGLAQKYFQEKILVYSLIGLAGQLSSQYEDKKVAGPMVKAGGLVSLENRWKFGTETGLYFDAAKKIEKNFRHVYLTQLAYYPNAATEWRFSYEVHYSQSALFLNREKLKSLGMNLGLFF